MRLEFTIYHNRRCSKSRQTLDLLRQRGIEPKVIDYLEHPPDERELGRLLGLLGISARELIRAGEKQYRELGLDDPALDEPALIRAMARSPILIQRPIVFRGDRAVIGRPPENVLGLLDG